MMRSTSGLPRMEPHSIPCGPPVHEYSKWLSPIPWQLFATFTFSWRVSDSQADMVFRAYIDCLEKGAHAPIAYIRGDEKRFSGCGKPGSPRHFHVLLASSVNLDPCFVKELWQHFGGHGVDGDSADVRLYDVSRSGVEYVLKMINRWEGGWDFHNLDLYIVDPSPRGRHLNHMARRRLARQQARETRRLLCDSTGHQRPLRSVD